MKILTSEKIDIINKKEKEGVVLNRREKICYKGIPNTRKRGIKFAHTTDELIEYSKCFNSIDYFIEKQAKVQLENDEIGKIKIRDYQKNAIDLMNDKKFVLFFRSRQVGITVSIALYFLHILLFNNDKKIIIISNKGQNGREFMKKIKTVYYNLPFFLKQGIIKWTENNIEFENGSRIDIISDVKDNKQIFFDMDIILLNEFSRIKNQNELYAEIFTQIKKDGKIIIDSGPNGLNFFYKLVTDSERMQGDPDKNLFNTMRIYWWQVLGRDENWKNEQIKIIGTDSFNQEYGLSFNK